jgi:hypothetical protein
MRILKAMKIVKVAIILLLAGMAMAQDEGVPVTFGWAPCPLRDGDGRPLAAAVRYDVTIMRGDAGEEYLATVANDTIYVLNAERGVAQRVRVYGFDVAGRSSPASAWSDTVFIEPPLDVAGLVLRQGGRDIVVVSEEAVTGDIEVHPGRDAEPIVVVFLDGDGGEFVLDDTRFNLEWTLGDGDLFGISAVDAWGFVVQELDEDILEGETDLTLILTQNTWLPDSLIDFASQPITVRVAHERGDPDGRSPDQLPLRPELKPNYPNPFNPETRLVYGVPEGTPAGTRMALEIFNMRGQRVRSFPIADAEAGWHDVIWDGRDGGGRLQSTGTYVMRFTCGNRVEVGKMSMIK